MPGSNDVNNKYIRLLAYQSPCNTDSYYKKEHRKLINLLSRRYLFSPSAVKSLKKDLMLLEKAYQTAKKYDRIARMHAVPEINPFPRKPLKNQSSKKILKKIFLSAVFLMLCFLTVYAAMAVVDYWESNVIYSADENNFSDKREEKILLNDNSKKNSAAEPVKTEPAKDFPVKDEPAQKKVPVQKKQNKIPEKEPEKKDLRLAKTVFFGNYPHTSRKGVKPLEWIVLDKDRAGNALLVSRYAIDAVRFSVKKGKTSWADSHIREWLNTYFLNNAFTKSEQENIVLSDNDNNSPDVDFSCEEALYWKKTFNLDANFMKSCGKPGIGSRIPGYYAPYTHDKVFLLSRVEALKYLKKQQMGAKPTEYALLFGVKMIMPDCSSGKCVRDSLTGTTAWWLRTRGLYPDSAMFVHGNRIYVLGGDSNTGLAVRPAIRVKNFYGGKFVFAE